MREIRWLFPALLVLALLPAGAAAQARGTISGRVTDAASGQALPGATVTIQGTTQGAVTAQDGRYTIRNVPTGSRTVLASTLGYATLTETVNVTAGSATTVDFALQASAIQIGGLIVTATGQEQRQREIGASVGSISTADVPLATVSSPAQILEGRVPGVEVLPSSGTTGAAARIRIRGSSSISLSNEPLLVVDGVPVNNNTDAFSYGIGGQSLSRLNDINPNDIEKIDVLKGPSASSLYGTAAANGVIVITTKKGHTGATQWHAWSEQGQIKDVTDYPNNYRYVGTILTGANAGKTTTNCNILARASGACRPDSLVSYNPLRQNTPFRTGYKQTYGLSASGGTERTTYFLSGAWSGTQGIYSNNNLNDLNLRANLGTTLTQDLTAQISTGYVSGDYQLPYNDNAVEGFIGGGLLGSPTSKNTTGGYYGYPMEYRKSFELRQSPNRFLSSLNATYTPMPWLSIVGTAGLDVTNNEDTYTILPGVFPSDVDPDYAEGQRQVDAVRERTYNATLAANTNYGIASDLTGATSIGGQYRRESRAHSFAYGQGLLPGTKSLNAASHLFQIGETNRDTKLAGAFVQQQLTWRDLLYVTGAIRGDDNSNFGQDFGLVWYPSVSASWVVDEEPFWPKNDIVSTLRVRGAWGVSGLQPGFRAATTYFNPVSAVVNSAEVPAVTIGGAGNTDLKPERSAETELGFDAGLLSNRLGLEFTYYRKISKDELVQRVLAPSLGLSSTQWFNLGEVHNSGVEGTLNIHAVRAPMISWDVTLNGQTNHNKLVTLGEGVAPIIFGLGGATQRQQEGYPLGSYFQQPIESYSDANGNGIIEPDEVQVGDTAVYLGQPFPTRELSFNTDLTLFGWLRVSALLDHKSGMKLYNATEDFRCGALLNCFAIQDPSAPLADQARAVADYWYSTVAGYIEDASFTKLREVSVTLSAPQRWAKLARVNNLSLTLSGRNLATWTDYTGLDPEVNFAGTANFSTAEFLTQPPVRQYVARIDVGF
ncbi:MAG TPA: SusC/RagA family TonB-linked outer membrane protein [Longimicrobiaceae bacterium]|nr:SusC/RagA family TonB-linked outer membrane protein [Longimicrobiaceae bacterium]